MLKSTLSLPPLLMDHVQGRLDFIIVRPVLVPHLSAHQSLDFSFCWWGNDSNQNLRLDSKVEELKVIYDICCDIQGIQRYFQDAQELVVDIHVSETKSTNASGKGKPQAKFTKYQLQKKTKWEGGDYVGTFTISDLKLNARGEFVKECNILNFYGDQCGSVVVFILYTKIPPKTVKDVDGLKLSERLLSKDVEAKSYERNFQVEKEQRKIDSKILSLDASYPESKELSPLSSSDHNEIKSMVELTPSTPSDVCVVEPVLSDKPKSKKELSPRFISFERQKTPEKTKSNKDKQYLSQKLKQFSKQCEISSFDATAKNHSPLHSVLTRTCTNPFESREVGSYLEQHKAQDSKFIITRLFSFVDSGAIRPSDLPTLIQICQGRSPSIDLDVSCPSDDLLASIAQGPRNYHEQDCKAPANSDNQKGGYSMLKKERRTVSFSGVSFQSDSGSSDRPSVTRVFDDNFISSLRTLRKPPTDNSNCSTDANHSPAPTIPQELKQDLPEVKYEDCSLLILKFDSINFATANEESGLKKKEPKLHSVQVMPVRHTVRQRSKLCYFIEASLAVEGVKNSPQSVLLVSRRIEKQDVLFGTNRIFKLLQPSGSEKLRGCLKFRVSRRRLGNRVRDLVGVGIVSLDQLRTEESCQVPVVLPLWLPTAGSGVLVSIRTISKGLEVPIGSLKFSVAFALVPLAEDDLKFGVDSVNKHHDYENEDIFMKKDSYFCPISESFVGSEVNEISSLRRPTQTTAASAFISNISAPKVVRTPNEKCPTSPSCLMTSPTTSVHTSRTTSVRVPLSFQNSKFRTIPTTNKATEGYSSYESLVVENGSCVDFVPVREEMTSVDLSKEVYLQILEGNGLPCLRSKATGRTFRPSSYVQATLPSGTFETEIVNLSSCPKWNYAADMEIHPDDFKHTNFFLILKVFHSRDGTVPHPDDTLLGFATIDTRHLWNSFVSLCGWIPLLNLNGDTCGELKVSLTPKRPRALNELSLKDITNVVHGNYPKSSKNVQKSATATTDEHSNLSRNSIKSSALYFSRSCQPDFDTKPGEINTLEHGTDRVLYEKGTNHEISLASQVTEEKKNTTYLNPIADVSLKRGNSSEARHTRDKSNDSSCISDHQIVDRMRINPVRDIFTDKKSLANLMETNSPSAARITAPMDAKSKFTCRSIETQTDNCGAPRFYRIADSSISPDLERKQESETTRFYDPSCRFENKWFFIPKSDERGDILQYKQNVLSCEYPGHDLNHARSDYHNVSPLVSSNQDHLETNVQDHMDISSDAKSRKPTQKPEKISKTARTTFEGFQWMNQLGTCDTPCVSYLDLDHLMEKTGESSKDEKSNAATSYKTNPLVLSSTEINQRCKKTSMPVLTKTKQTYCNNNSNLAKLKDSSIAQTNPLSCESNQSLLTNTTTEIFCRSSDSNPFDVPYHKTGSKHKRRIAANLNFS